MNPSLLCLLLTLAQPPVLPDGTEEAKQSIAKLQKIPAGFKVDVWAAEPMLGNPVAFCIDEKGRIFTAESYRFNRGTEEYRTRPFFLEGDLQNSTTQERLAMYKKFADKFPGGMEHFTKYSERIRLLEDTKGLGKADKATTFADGFNEPLAGLAAGVLAKDGDVYFTCIPHLWKITSEGSDPASAKRKQKLLSGFGVQTAFLGHDLHGLIFGPDGRLYFSVGDRGFHVVTKEGKTLSGPRTGSVFRCDPDGSNLEVVHTGLRNPQELAFDQFGNLFAADNNCDKGDASRLVYIVEGGDSGWRMEYQTMEAPYLTGPWHAEKLWHLHHEGQPAWIVPPVGHLGAGPSGFHFTSGLGLPDRYKNAFLMCNFSSSKGGGIDSFRVVPKGAGFELVDYHQMLGPGLFTDVDQGYDGKLYYSDWVQFTWDGGGVGKGRIFSAYDPKAIQDPEVMQMKGIMARGFRGLETKELVALLHHPDMRVRLRAQYGLAESRAVDTLKEVASKDASTIARIHAIWAIGQILRAQAPNQNGPILTYGKGGLPGQINFTRFVADLMEDKDSEIRVQAAKAIGEAGPNLKVLNNWSQRAANGLRKMFEEGNAREKYFAVLAMGKYHLFSTQDFLKLVKHDNGDPYILHAAVIALVHRFPDDATPISELLKNKEKLDKPQRLALVLVLRQWYDRAFIDFLNDSDEAVVLEAARALYDRHVSDSFSTLSRLASHFSKTPQPNEALGRRIVNANFRLGKDENAKALLDILINPKVSPVLRQECLACLSEWEKPGPRDRVIGAWRPLPPRSAEGVRKLVEQNLEAILANSTAAMQTDVVKLIAKLDVKVDDATFAAWVHDAGKAPATRIESLRLLSARKSKQLEPLLEKALEDQQPGLRATARDLITLQDPLRGLGLIREVLAKGDLLEQQAALRTVAKTTHGQAQYILADWIKRLEEDKAPAGLQLDVFQASKTTANKALKKRIDDYQESLRKQGGLAPYRMTLEGGDAERGKHVFWSHATGQCLRCHKIKGEGGDVGPDLAEWAPKGNREHFLESLILPDKKITPGYGTLTLSLDSGKTVSGVLKSEDKENVVLLTQDQKTLTIAVKDIDFRSDVKSAMPGMAQVLSLEEMRDIIAFPGEFEKVIGYNGKK